MRNINSVLINNSLKGDSVFKTLELLHKIGVLPTKKKKTTRKSKMYDEEGNEIKQTHDMGEGYAETKDDKKDEQKPSSRLKNGSAPLQIGYNIGSTDSIQNINKAIEDKKVELKALENKPFNSQQIEDIRRDTISQLGLLTDKLEQVQTMGKYMGGALYSLGSRFGQIEEKIRQAPEPAPVGISEPVDPFKNVEGAGDAVESATGDDYEDEDIDMTNQGSQDIPENIMSVDVVPQADEALEDEDVEMPQLEATPKEPEEIKSEPSDKFRVVENFYGFLLPRGKNQSVEAIKNYVKTLANESQTKINYNNLKNRKQWEDKMNELVNKQYDLIQSGDAISYNQRFETVLNELELVKPSNKLNSQKTFLFVLMDKLGRSYKKSDFTTIDKVESEIKKLVNEHYNTIE